ncbi:hypothetical protein IW261DRAFT_1490744 [Armillaria novae-zelandiae]|uniref:Uncharacterized protein n=1 Tax=Armillaria novae-zelandiae TaxID=153914 RepID=A0AA39P3K0_9AGAR|nr:hypothetical protein IW261DRAFT_1490744 [Armillaria novae-zelandiae]
MGQYWRLVNIDKREDLGHWGKLGEAFLDEDKLGGAIALLASSWAGCRIMCIGDYTTDCPPNVLTSEEVAEINACDTEDWDSDDESAPTFYDFTRWFEVIRSDGSINMRGMVLRNLTKHVYVRRDVVVKELANEPYPGDIGNILLMNICWSDDSSCSMCVDLSQGGWAGDRFDVVPLSSVEDNEEEWEDVTEDQVKLTRPALQW